MFFVHIDDTEDSASIYYLEQDNVYFYNTYMVQEEVF